MVSDCPRNADPARVGQGLEPGCHVYRSVDLFPMVPQACQGAGLVLFHEPAVANHIGRHDGQQLAVIGWGSREQHRAAHRSSSFKGAVRLGGVAQGEARTDFEGHRLGADGVDDVLRHGHEVLPFRRIGE